MSMKSTFHKMHGLGNDFVILDMREISGSFDVPSITPARSVAFIADRHQGIGCDQVIIIKKGDIPFMRIFNADGSEVAACGNATRCVAWLLMQETGLSHTEIHTATGLLSAYLTETNEIRVMMGVPGLAWERIPLNRQMDTLRIVYGECSDGVAVSMGNPHLVMFVDDSEAYPLADIGPVLECAPLFPERANITVAEIRSRQDIRLRTWERGVGETLACGTAACAAMVAARRRGLVEKSARLHATGGAMLIEWPGDESDPNHPVFMTGPVSYVFKGDITLPF